MGKIVQNPKIGQLWRPVAPQPYVVQKKLTRPRKLLALGLQRGISLQCISWPVACSKWGACLTPSKFRVLGANDLWMESFRNFLSKICVSTAIHVSWSNLAKIGRGEVAEKSSDKKTLASGILLSIPPISAPFNPSRPKFPEHCQPLTCACVPTLVQIGCGLPDLCRKESKIVINIRFQPTKKHSLLTASLLCYYQIGEEKMAYTHK